MTLIILFLLTFLLSITLTVLVRLFSIRMGMVDRPETDPGRKMHRFPVPLLGGLAVYLSFAIMVLGIVILKPHLLLGGYLLPKHLAGLLLGGLLLMIGGWLDDRRPQKALLQLIWPILAALVVIASGIGIAYITNPFGGTVDLHQWNITLFTWHGIPYRFVLFADLFAFLWLMVAMYSTKLLDGLDGLVSGITLIGMFVLFLVSMADRIGQPETALLALLAAASFFGFLFLNFHPARIFLGEGGSLLAGFLLGTLAIISGGKIATALLILGIPMFDILVVVLLRMLQNRKALVQGDRRHIHFRLLALGLSHRQTVVALYLATAVFGGLTVFVEGKTKAAALVTLVFFMVILAVIAVQRVRRMEKIQRNSVPPAFK